MLLRSGSTRNYFSDLDFSSQSLNPTATGFMLNGNDTNNAVGYSVSRAGDVNNDGYDDIIIGAPLINGAQGAVYVIYGGEQSAFLDIDLSTTSLNPLTTGFIITGRAAVDRLGASVSTAGDVDNDGYDDIIIGAAKTGYQGSVYVIYGGPKSSMSNIDLSSQTLNPSTTGFKLTGIAANEWFGVSVSTAGDINNDGYDDIIIGAPWKDNNKGVAYVIYGGSRATRSNWDFSSATLTPSTTGFMITGNANQDLFGSSVSTAGDINNDGYDDIIVGASHKNTNQGATYVIYGGPKATRSNIALSSTTLNPLTTGFTITGNGGSFGFSVSTAGDINKDGYDDIIIGAPGPNNYFGEAYVIYGRTKSSTTNIALSTTPLNPLTTGFMMKGNSAYNYFGYSVSTAGDINNDGYADIIVGAYGKNNQKGSVYVIYGNFLF